MNFNLFLIILIALLIIFCIILYNGIRILLVVGKEKGIVKYEFKVTILKIPIFKRAGSEGIIDIIKSKDSDEDLEKTKEEDSEPKDDNSKTKKESSKSKDKTQDKKITEHEEGILEPEEQKEKKEEKEEESPEEEEKGLREKYKEIKPILNELKKAKEELKAFLKNILKAINLKKLEGHLILGLSDHATTIKIASWIWSIGAIVNSKKPTLLTVEPRFAEIIIDFEGKIELKINLLLLIIYSLLLLTQKNIRELIKALYREYKSQSKEEEESVEKESLEEDEEINKVKEESFEDGKNSIEKEIREEIKKETSEKKESTLEEEIEEEIEETEEKDDKEEAVAQVKQLMKIIKSDWNGWNGNNK